MTYQNQREQTGEDQLLIDWLRDEREDLVKQAAPNYQESRFHSVGGKVLTHLGKLFFLVCADPEVFDGHSIAFGESKRHATLTSGVVSGATLFNAITNWPILFYTLAYLGFGAALTLSGVLNFILLWWTNQTGTTAASRKHGNALWSVAGVMAFLAMSTVQSVVAGVGAELINNREGLSYLKAEELVDEQIKELNSASGSHAAVKAACEQQETYLDSLDPQSVQFSRHFIRIYGGTFAQVNSGNLANYNAPCSYTLLNESAQKAAAAEPALEQFEEGRRSMNNDIEFLKAIGQKEGGPKTYKQHFREEVEPGEGDEAERTIYVLRSGEEATKMAIKSFLGIIQEEDKLKNMNMSTFFFFVSVITSLSAALLIMMHSFKLETKMSNSSDVKEAVTYWLEDVRRQYAQRDEREDTTEKRETNKKLLSLYIKEYRSTGRCDYPKVQAIAKMSQAGMDIRLIQKGADVMADINQAYEDIDEASSMLIDHFVAFSSQKSQQPKKFPGVVNVIDTLLNGDKEDLGSGQADTRKMELNNGDLVKKNLSKLRKGVTRLILLSNRYAATISLAGERKYCMAIRSMEKKLKDQLSELKVPPYNASGNREIMTAAMYRSVSDLPSQLIQLQVDCAELQEIAEEEIRNKLIPLFGDFEQKPEA